MEKYVEIENIRYIMAQPLTRILYRYKNDNFK